MTADDAFGREYWERVLQVKQAVNKCLEEARNEKLVKASLAAEVTLYADEQITADLDRLGDELRFVLITSTASIEPLANGADARETAVEGLKVAVKASEEAKCARCWHHREDVGQNTDHPELCTRCVDNVEGEGEQRHYA
jgi:isoleucyl-tRNA synthetase